MMTFQKGERSGQVCAGQLGGDHEAKGAPEAARPLPQAQLEPDFRFRFRIRPEAFNGAAGQAALPQNHQRAAELRCQVLLHQRQRLQRGNRHPHQPKVWHQPDQQSPQQRGECEIQSYLENPCRYSLKID